LVTPELLLEKCYGCLTTYDLEPEDADGASVLHLAALSDLKYLRHLITSDMLFVRDNQGATVAHDAARYGTLIDLIQVVTPELLSEKDDEGLTVAHLVAENPKLIPLLLSANFHSQMGRVPEAPGVGG